MAPSAEQRERRAACGIQATGQLQLHFTTQTAMLNIAVTRSNSQVFEQHFTAEASPRAVPAGLCCTKCQGLKAKIAIYTPKNAGPRIQ